MSHAVTIAVCVVGIFPSVAFTAPPVRITSPVDGAELRAGEKFNVSAVVSPGAPGGRVVKVEFFVWSPNLRVGEAVAPPFTAEVTPRELFAKARFSLTARATDDQGAATDSHQSGYR